MKDETVQQKETIQKYTFFFFWEFPIICMFEKWIFINILLLSYLITGV